jgi:hypothetical protein
MKLTPKLCDSLKGRQANWHSSPNKNSCFWVFSDVFLFYLRVLFLFFAQKTLEHIHRSSCVSFEHEPWIMETEEELFRGARCQSREDPALTSLAIAQAGGPTVQPEAWDSLESYGGYWGLSWGYGGEVVASRGCHPQNEVCSDSVPSVTG